MTEQQTVPHLSTHIRLAMQIADQEARSASAWAAREVERSFDLDKHQAAARERKAELRAYLEQEAAKVEAQYAELDAEERRLVDEMAEAGRRKEGHAREADDAKHSVLDWCTRHGIRPEDLPPVSEHTGPQPAIPAGASGPQPVVGTGPQAALPGGVQALTADQIRDQMGLERKALDRPCANCGAAIYHDRLLGQFQHTLSEEPACWPEQQPDGPFADPSHRDERPILPQSDTLTTRRELPVPPTPPGGDPAEAGFHPGAPDTADDAGRGDA